LEAAAIPQCRAALQRGAAPALRPRLWAAALALDLEHEFLGDSFENLCSQVEECNLLTDLLVSMLAPQQDCQQPTLHWPNTTSTDLHTSCQLVCDESCIDSNFALSSWSEHVLLTHMLLTAD